MAQIITETAGKRLNYFERYLSLWVGAGMLAGVMLGKSAIRAGRNDARQGRPPHLWIILSDPGERPRLLHSGGPEAGRLLLVALVLDTVYQLIEFRWFTRWRPC